MTLKEAAGDVLSVSQLSRFENERSMLPADIFYLLLKNTNTTLSEFYFLLGEDIEKELRDFFHEVVQYTAEKEYEQLRQMESRIRKSSSFSYSWNKFMGYFIESLIQLEKGEEQTNRLFVEQYLMQIENWGEMELRIYGMFGFIFEVETTYRLMKIALKRSRTYQSAPQYLKILYTILTNNFSTFLFHNRLDYAEETIRLFEEEYSENLELLIPYLNILFNKGILAYKKQDPTKGKEYCEQAISLCRFFNQPARERIFQKRYKQWRNDYADPNFKELAIEPGLFNF